MNGLSSLARYNMGECKNDTGGYFIIDGKEKVIISDPRFILDVTESLFGGDLYILKDLHTM